MKQTYIFTKNIFYNYLFEMVEENAKSMELFTKFYIFYISRTFGIEKEPEDPNLA